ncbi:LuxE/PaaK family acyltransferase [Ureibacillus thermosphaericus]|uniref:Acyl-protein synthetase LuxE domain-containing protein n=1 Tax=Ureibacillus thermosphaericus TaxID=51173 RepID=A0A840PRM3_URETH|nr:long-chain fatty acid--CoA ligase [Ureibacillus thermosphaericus]MBB5148457.1 hypothetical protein [Ureibacillus thermosphaericus]NKZ31211.1 long-chain fatty acid--CoA ligase [Ureibacillus thermosphaericus]
MTQQREIIEELSQFIKKNQASEEEFNSLALHIFNYQYKHNLPYQTFCRQKGKTPRLVKNWRDIPYVPMSAFKEVPLTCSDPEAAVRVFMTSGTTQGKQGKHFHSTLEIRELSMIINFKERFMKETNRIRMGILFPTEEKMPHSSLAHYLALVMKEFGTEDSCYLLKENGVHIQKIISELEHAEKTGEPFALLGASFSFVHLFEELERLGKTFNLPKGSKILDSGGYKNKSKELDLNEFYQLLERYFGVDRSNCINMYGITELSTQFYDDGNEVVPSIKTGPSWIRTRVINPLTGEEVPEGERGVLVHYDLANFNSVMAVATEDVGMAVDEGFYLFGRVQGAEARGCSLAVEEFIQLAKGTAK